MEAVGIRTPKKKKNNNKRSFSSSRSSENLAPANMYGGLFPIPPLSPSFSYPPSASVLNNNICHPYNHHHHQQNYPPLLPLPIIPISRSSSSLSSRSSTISPTRKINNRAKDQSVVMPKKLPKSKSPNQKDQAKAKSESLVVASTNRLGPEPKDLPKDVPKVMVSSASLGKGGFVMMGDLEEFSGGSAISLLSPHPSSLPQPKFSLRPNSKLSCNAEAAGIDSGATDNLRRLLRLR